MKEAKLLLIAFTATFLGLAAGPGAQVPARTNILASLKSEHPRLLLDQSGFAELKERIAKEPQLKSWYGQLQRNARQVVTAPPSRYEIPDGLRLLATSRRVLDRVYTLSLVFKLSGETELKERIWQELAAAAEFPDWNPKHFLDTAEMTHAFAIGYDWLYEHWTEEQRSILRRAIVEKGFAPALPIYRKDNSWARSTHNWNQVCNGGLGMGALALADVEKDLAGEILHSAVKSLPRAMVHFAPDGAWNEGPGYWNYATIYNVVILAALQTALGTDFGLSEMEGFGETGSFPIHLTGPLGRTFNYADGGDRTIRAPQLFWLASRFSEPAYAAYQIRHASPSALDLVWFPRMDTTAADLPLDRFFRDSEVVTMRSKWRDPKALFVGFKAGDNKANHSHLDLGSFVFDALGVRWAVDPGADNYNLPGYFGGRRWEYYRLRAEGQNTLLVNPDAGPGQEPKAATKIVKFHSTPERAIAIADLTSAYSPQAESVKRGIGMFERNRLLIQDEIKSRTNAVVWWFMHTAADISIGESGRTAILKQDGATLRASLLEPANAVFHEREAAPLPGSPNPPNQAANEGFKKLAVQVEGTSNTRLAILLEPVTNPDAASPPPKLVPLADW